MSLCKAGSRCAARLLLINAVAAALVGCSSASRQMRTDRGLYQTHHEQLSTVRSERRLLHRPTITAKKARHKNNNSTAIAESHKTLKMDAYGLSSYCDNWILGPRSPIPRTPIQRPALAPVSPPGAISFRGADGRGRFNRSDAESPLLGCWAPLPAHTSDPSENGPGLLPSGSTLCGAVHIECLCCCVNVPAQGWALSNRVCHHPRRVIFFKYSHSDCFFFLALLLSTDPLRK